MFLYHINIGSNLGDSRSAIERAVAGIFSLSQGPRRRSATVESEPWGFASAHSFLNVGVEITTEMLPLELLVRLQQIEKAISPHSHRNPDGTYRDREIDIDMIFALENGDPVCMSDSRLTLPHPRAIDRGFVTGPVAQLHPGIPVGELIPAAR